MNAPRSALVVNPHALAGRVRAAWDRSLHRIRRALAPGGYLETGGDGRDVERIGRWLDETRPATVVAAGGDGTVSDVVAALMQRPADTRPALGILPLGTANNVARSLDLPSVRLGGVAAVETTIAAVRDDRTRPLDVGCVGTRYFVGSLAVGMDADILVLRNRLRRQLELGRRLGGYPLYLWSCAVNVVARAHGAHARLTIDGAGEAAPVYNLLVTNTALYAGEFMFDVANRSDDGWLDLHTFTSAGDYVRRYVQAWRRHVAITHHRPAAPAAMRRVRALDVSFPQPLPVQIDGEELAPTARLEIRVLPGALRVRTPAGERAGAAAGERTAG